jgi:CRISPR/Cas system-associated exonuclease Cas4 (RecB family)
LQRIFEMGNILHDFVVEVLKSEKNPNVELLKSEFPFRVKVADFIVSGRVDNLILLKRDGKSVLVEVKSTKDVKYVKKASKGHAMQLQLYMHFTGVHNGIILYIGKSDLQSKIFEVKYDPKEADKIISRFKALHKCLKTDKMPEPEAKQDEEMGWMCRYCEYSDRCK